MHKPKLLCLHGFLGFPHHFDFLKDSYEVFAPNLSEYVDLNINEVIEKLETQIDFNEYSIVGYSFGSRLGLQILSQRNEFKSFIGLAGHMGLKSEEERVERLKFENLMIQKLDQMNEDDFLTEWDQYDIFKHDKSTQLANFSNAKLFFKNYGLSKQPYLQEVLKEQKSKILMFYGKLDIKYKNYALESLSDYTLKLLPQVGHRILNHQELVRNICRENI